MSNLSGVLRVQGGGWGKIETQSSPLLDPYNKVNFTKNFYQLSTYLKSVWETLVRKFLFTQMDLEHGKRLAENWRASGPWAVAPNEREENRNASHSMESASLLELGWFLPSKKVHGMR